MKPVKVGLLGLGTVGGGTFNVLRRNAQEIARRAGRGIEIPRDVHFLAGLHNTTSDVIEFFDVDLVRFNGPFIFYESIV